MALVIDLKPQEKILIGEAVITNDSQRTRIHIAGNAPILREKDVMQEDEATSPCKKIYFLIQCMYLANDIGAYKDKYFEMEKEIEEAAPSCTIFFAQINDEIIKGHFYKALKLAKQLIDHEEELLNHARQQISQ